MGGYGAYWLAICAAALASLFVLRSGMRGAGLARGAFGRMAALSVALGAMGARGYYVLAHDVMQGYPGGALLCAQPYAYAMCGAVLGVLAAAALTARLTRCPTGALLDAATPAGLAMIALARMAELLADFGWGPMIGLEALRRFPVGVRDAFGEWRYAVFILEALCAVGVLAYAARGRGGRFSGALTLWAATQIVCESMRAETLRWGFVRVQQVQCALLMLAVLVWRTRRSGRFRAGAWAGFACGALAVAAMEFALDKGNWPRAACYAGMTAAAAGMAAAVRAAGRAGKEGHGAQEDGAGRADDDLSVRDGLRADGDGLWADGGGHGAAD